MNLREKAMNLINWSELSLHVSKKRKDTFRRDRIPERNKEDIDLLISYIEAWINCKELTTKETVISEVEYKVKEQISIIVTEIQKIGKNPFIKP